MIFLLRDGAWGESSIYRLWITNGTPLKSRWKLVDQQIWLDRDAITCIPRASTNSRL